MLTSTKSALVAATLSLGLLSGQAAQAQAANLVNFASRIDEGFHDFNKEVPNLSAAQDSVEAPLLLHVRDGDEQQPPPPPAKSDDENSGPSLGFVGTTLLTLIIQTIVCATTGICALTLPGM